MYVCSVHEDAVQEVERIDEDPDGGVAVHERGVVGHDGRRQNAEDHVEYRQRLQHEPVRLERVPASQPHTRA